jgi:hypothetical protein
MKKIFLFIVLLSSISFAQLVRQPMLSDSLRAQEALLADSVGGLRSDIADSNFVKTSDITNWSVDSIKAVNGTASILIKPDDNYGIQISRPNDDVGIKIKVNDQKTGWIVFSNEDGTALGEIEFDTDGTTETFEIGTNEDYPIILRSNGINTLTISDTNMVVLGYITADSVLVGGVALPTVAETKAFISDSIAGKLDSDFNTSLDELSAPASVAESTPIIWK